MASVLMLLVVYPAASSTEPLASNLMRFAALQTIEAGVDYPALWADIHHFILHEKRFLSKETVQKIAAESPAENGSPQAIFASIDTMLKALRTDVKNRPQLDNAALQRFAQRYDFRLSSHPSENEILATFDAHINRLFIMHLLRSLKQHADDIDMEELKRLTTRSVADVNASFAKNFVPHIDRMLRRKNRAEKNSLLYIAVGCGSGEKDMQTLSHIYQTFPTLSVHAYCLDPYQTKKGHPFTLAGGILDTTPLAPHETITARAQSFFNDKDAMPLVTGHYAFHHMGMSFAAFLESVGNATSLLFETHVSEALLNSAAARLQKLAIDLLINFGIDETKGTNWVHFAMQHPDNAVFQAYYLSDASLQTQAPASQKIWLNRGNQMLVLTPAHVPSF